MEIRKQHNSPAFRAKIGKIDANLIKNHGIKVAESILDAIPGLKAIGDDTIEFSIRESLPISKRESFPADKYAGIYCKKQIGEAPALLEPKTKVGKLWNIVFPPRSSETKFVEDFQILSIQDNGFDSNYIIGAAKDALMKDKIQNAIKDFAFYQKIKELAQGAKELGIM